MKILIWDKNIQLKNTGGPAGYLYNMHEFLKNSCNEHISFYSDLVKIDIINHDQTVASTFFKRLKTFKIVRFVLDLIHIYFKKIPLSKSDILLINEFDFVHFHSIYDLWSISNRNQIKSKVILTTHTPEPFYDEFVSQSGYECLKTHLNFLRLYFIKKECDTYKGADYIMLPVREAAEVYTIDSKMLKKTFMECENKFFYVPTSLFPSEKVGVNYKTLDKYNIPSEAIKLCYIGRHNEVKGFKSLQRMAHKIWQKNPYVYFIIGGMEEPLKGLNDYRWIELGWVRTPDILKEIDAFILPNKNTYFDLILLEVLREGKMCIVSSTGGNKWFENHAQEGVWNYEYNDDNKVNYICEQIQAIKKNGDKERIENEIRNYFLENFTAQKFINGYINSISNLK